MRTSTQESAPPKLKTAASGALLAAGVDAGSWRTRCVILALEGNYLRYLGHGEAASSGWHRGRVADQKRVSDSIRDAVRAAEQAAGFAVESAVVGVGGPTIRGYDSHWAYRFARPRAVSGDEMAFAIERAAQVNLEHDRMILHICPQFFTVDGRPGVSDPTGMECTRLEANVHLVTTATQETQNVVAAMHQAALAVEETVYEPLAAAYAAVLPEERSRGVAVVDIGMQSTDLVIYDGDALVQAASLPVSGDHLTKDVAWGLCVAYEDAEELKCEYGCVPHTRSADTSTIVVPSRPQREGREVSRRELNRILDARSEELFAHVAQEIARVGMDRSLLEGVVLTGAVTLLDGMLDMAEHVLHCQARKGLPVGVKDLPGRLQSPEWTTAVGLAMYSARLKLRRQMRRRPPGILGLIMR
jgi:cell division protein FtsA